MEFMLRNGYNANQCKMGQNGAPVHVPYRTLQRWWRHFQWWGEVPIATRRRRKRGPACRGRMTMPVRLYLKRLVDNDPSLFLDEMQSGIKHEFNHRYSISTIHRVLTTPRRYGGLGYSLKLLTRLAVQACREERRLYLDRLRQVDNPRQFVFIDESTVGRNEGRRRRGWGALGVEVPGYEIFQGDNDAAALKKTFTVIAAVDIDGFVLDACDAVYRKYGKTDTSPDRGTVDAERFLQYVNDRLIPTLGLRALGEPRSIVVLDNATIHKDVRIQNAIEASGAEVIWTAAYSPDLNPIERCFALYKKVLIRQHRAFRENPHDTHLYALENLNCVSPKIMCNL